MSHHKYRRYHPPVISTFGPQRPARRRLPWRRLLVGAMTLLFIFAILQLWQWAYSQMPGYLLLDGSPIVQVQMKHTTLYKIEHLHLILYGEDHHPTDQIDCYINEGQKLTIEGDTLTFASWLGLLGLHSGYKLLRIEGCSTNPTHMNTHDETVFVNNDGHDSFFNTVQGQQWLSWLVQAHSNQSITLTAENTSATYNVTASSKGLSVKSSH